MHYPSLSLHPSRRVRLLTSSIHAQLLGTSGIQPAFLDYLREHESSETLEYTLGSLLMAAHDQDRQVSIQGMVSLRLLVTLVDTPQLSTAVPFLVRVIFSPEEIYTLFFPAHRLQEETTAKERVSSQPAETSSPFKHDTDEDIEGEIDRAARWRHGAINSLRWFTGTRVWLRLIFINS